MKPVVGRSLMAALSLAVSVLISGCTLGPVWARHIEGRIVDGITGRPIAGATITLKYSAVAGGGHGGSHTITRRSRRSDSDGHFAFRGRPIVTLIPLASTDFEPETVVFHPAYGSTFTSEIFDRPLVIEVYPDKYYLDGLHRERQVSEICGSRIRAECEEALNRIYPEARDMDPNEPLRNFNAS